MSKRIFRSDAASQDATLVMDDISGTCHGTGTAGQAFVGENKCTVFRDLNGGGGTSLFTQTASDAGNIAYMETTGVLVGAEDNDGVGLYTEVDHSLGAGTVAGTATDTLAFVYLCNTVSIDIDGTETAHIDTGTATGTAIMAQI